MAKDTRTARFAQCFLPVITAIPAILAALVLLTYSAWLFKAYRPKWTKPFIIEGKENPDDLGPEPTRPPLSPTYGLLLVSSIGLASQILTIFFPFRDLAEVYPSIAWVSCFAFYALICANGTQAIIVAILVIERPRTAPILLLIPLVGLLASQIVVLSYIRASLTAKSLSLIFAPFAAFSGILVILNMPLRDPAMSSKGISAVYTTSTGELRTPEDNITPLQFMTVSWMAPLIKKGTAKNINEEDVWDLGYEFKHERLHSAFRVLQGTVFRRLLQANGMDVVRTTILALIQLAASMF